MQIFNENFILSRGVEKNKNGYTEIILGVGGGVLPEVRKIFNKSIKKLNYKIGKFKKFSNI